jgi:hypothetical protein
MKVTLFIQASLTVSTSEFVIALYAASAPTVVLQTQTPAKPYGDPIQVEFDGLTYGLGYNIILWESTDGTASGIARNSGSFTALSNSITLRADLVLIVGRDSGFAAGGTKYTDPSNSLAGWTYSLENRGVGTMIPPSDANPEYSLDANNNFTLIDGETFQTNQVFILHFQPQSAQIAPSSPSLISSGVTLNSNTTLDNTAVNKAIYLQGTAAVFTVTLPALSTITDYQVLYFYSAGGNHVNVNIVTPGTDLFQRKTTISIITLGQNEILKLFKANGKWQVDCDLRGVDEVGQKFTSDFSNELISQSSWANTDGSGNYINKGFYGTGDGSTTFTVPDLTAYGFRRAKAASPGTFQVMDVQPHTHNQKVYVAINNGGTLPVGYRDVQPGDPVNSGVPTAANTGAETRPNNTAEYLYLRI